jgi:hypothetical protein
VSLVELELEFFKSEVTKKLTQAAGTWTQAEKALLPALNSKLSKREEPIRKEVKMYQERIKQLDAEISKLMPISKAAKKEFD